MGSKRHHPDEIFTQLREADVLVRQGMALVEQMTAKRHARIRLNLDAQQQAQRVGDEVTLSSLDLLASVSFRHVARRLDRAWGT